MAYSVDAPTRAASRTVPALGDGSGSPTKLAIFFA
jgi:hypothetical protein